MARLEPFPTTLSRSKMPDRLPQTALDVTKQYSALQQAKNGEAFTAQAAGADAGAWVAAHGPFSEGLTHDAFGRVRRRDLTKLIQQLTHSTSGVDRPFPGVYTSGQGAVFDVRLYKDAHGIHTEDKANRAYESPMAGHPFDLDGVDPDAVGMAPAPRVGSDELTFEMAKVCVAAPVPDCHSTEFQDHAVQPETGINLTTLTGRLPGMPFATSVEKRAKARGVLSTSTMLRGSTPGCPDRPFPLAVHVDHERPAPFAGYHRHGEHGR